MSEDKYPDNSLILRGTYHPGGRFSYNREQVDINLIRSENYPATNGGVRVVLNDGQYIISDNFHLERRNWPRTNELLFCENRGNWPRTVIGVEHDLSVAAGRAYRKMRRRATSISRDEQREVVVDLDESLDVILKGHK